MLRSCQAVVQKKIAELKDQVPQHFNLLAANFELNIQ